MMFFLGEGFRVIAHDRRGHGRSSQTDTGNDMDTYAEDVKALVTDARPEERHPRRPFDRRRRSRALCRAPEPGRVAKAVLLDAVPPVMVKKDSNPGGTPIEVFDGFRAALAANRAQLYLDIPSGPFYSFNQTGVTPIEGLIRNWWRQGMMGSVKAGYECIKAFSETDFTDDLKTDRGACAGHPQRSRPDRALCGLRAAQRSKLLKNGRLKTYKDLPHGCHSTHPDLINADILEFARGDDVGLKKEDAPALVAEPIPVA